MILPHPRQRITTCFVLIKISVRYFISKKQMLTMSIQATVMK